VTRTFSRGTPSTASSTAVETNGRRGYLAAAPDPDAVADVRAGKGQAIGFLVGQVMKATRGQANAAVAQAALRERLEGPEVRT
jgi:hypothetical protein